MGKATGSSYMWLTISAANNCKTADIPSHIESESAINNQKTLSLEDKNVTGCNIRYWKADKIHK